MKKVSIKYNPYKLETEIIVDGKKLKQNSSIGEKSAVGSRLQGWVEELPRMLVDEYNDTAFEIEFHGTLLDYEDIISVFTEANGRGEINAEIKERIRAKETSDKEALIAGVFDEILKGPFEELRHEQIISAFQHAKSSDFEVCVVATMSAGKSTLINAMIGSKLMPSKMEACTAIITRIKDISSDNIPFQAEAYDKENHLMEAHAVLSLPIMERLNADDNVYVIKISGNIPFVSSDDVSLVLIDTPGPNNSRDLRHRKVQSELLGKSSKALVLYIMTGEFGTDDDNALLKDVAESMAVSGKQSKDRFIFVVNKLDDRKKEDGDTNQTLERVRSYLKTHGVDNPNLFPAAALPALNLRMIMSGADVDDDTIDETEVKVKKLNRPANGLYFEEYAPLPASIRGEIKGQLDEVRSSYEGRDNENQHEALIHTGIVSIEAAIRQYVQKYAKTAKIKNIVDTFTNKLEELGNFEKLKRELAENREKSEEFVKKIADIRKKMDSAEEAKKFKNAVDDAVVKVNDDSKEVVEGIIQKFQSRITKRIDKLRGRQLDLHDAEDEVERLGKFAKKLEPDFEVELDELIRNNLINTSDVLLEGYRKKLASLAEEVDSENLVGIKIDPLKLMGGSISYGGFSTKKLVKEKEVKDGEEWVANTDKKWYKPWTWSQEKGYYRATYKTVKYIYGDALAQEFFRPVQQILYDNGEAAGKYAIQQSKRIADRFNLEFKHLDNVLKEKLDVLESYATDKEKADERIKELEPKLKWLEEIKSKVESILEI
ncbi:MAG: dynamin family protein [Defluviitaleaceae bacterium]|nr:dynamin family protein [Defluviitaleaceae bacterium]